MDRNTIDDRSARLLAVVPRKGDVDRNSFAAFYDYCDEVVPRKGDVDRNGYSGFTVTDRLGRPPQGGRG